MGTENAPGASAETAATEAKGVADSFIRTLGLSDLIFGSLLIYWARQNWSGVDWSRILPTTGRDWVDVALLACAAAFAGKALSLLVQLWTALVDVLFDRTNSIGLGYSHALRLSLDAYAKAVGVTRHEKSDDRDLALAYVTVAAPQQGALLDRVRDSSSIAYSASVIAGLYAHYLSQQPTAPGLLTTVLIVIGFLLFITGAVSQLDYVHTLGDRVEALLAAEPLKLAGGE
jgi:hypothetical protein